MPDEENLPERSQTYTKGEIAYMMKRRGLSLTDIAQELRVAVTSVNSLIDNRFKVEAAEHTPETRQSILMMEDDRLEYYLSQLWPGIEEGDPRSITAALGIHDRKIKLHRLDTPDASVQQSAILVVSGAEQDYIASLKTAIKD